MGLDEIWYERLIMKFATQNNVSVYRFYLLSLLTLSHLSKIDQHKKGRLQDTTHTQTLGKR